MQPEDGADPARGTSPAGGGLTRSPGLLAALAAGLLAAFCLLWGLRGLPLGVAFLWLTPLPLFLAGLGFGVVSAGAAALIATLLIAVAGGGLPAAVFLVLFGVPVVLLIGAGLRGERLVLSLPLALLGLWPAVVLLGAAVLLPAEGGLEAAMRRGVEAALLRMGLPAPEQFVEALVRVKAAALGFWASLALLGNAAAAQNLLVRRGLNRAAKADWTVVKLPFWYPALPGIAALGFLLAPADADAIPLSLLLLLLVPLFFQGIAGVHRRLAGRKSRVPMLAAFYFLLLLFLQLVAPALVGLGLHDQFRRPAPNRT